MDRDEIARLIPHQGAMCLLDGMLAWTADWVLCRATSHLSPANPLRRDGRLGVLAGIEYAMQATALHGALIADRTPRGPAYLAALRAVSVGPDATLDRPSHGVLRIQVWLEHADAAGFIYRFDVATETGAGLLSGRAVIASGAGLTAANSTRG